ncbi:MAG: 5-formyltetrahydrofolate cyclo-ligase [Thermodesulfovibrio sp.]|nr:5-formyltetrahydrofolate cyclo-ligase [Thermodesulfovibrio sp.]MCX7725021.1 5-formyltetrahydrofolate cyclo-ligase [Thermodesulfovibrio sp.]MDW7972380.1 5-formyltetrahydrofolate cyclo-ligase [Thermodesulfovibrio sp.]
MNKGEIRKKMLEVRNNIQREIKNQKDERIARAFINLISENKIQSVLLYASFGSEVDTWRIFHFCSKNSIKTAFPKVSANKLEVCWVNDIKELSPGYRSILEPKSCNKASLEDIEVIIVPGVAFDKKCFRLGYGGGFYDRLLLFKKGLAIGLSYEEQILDEIPKESHDKKLDLIITDERMISCD